MPPPQLLLNRTVLVVDNDPDIRTAIDMALQAEGALTQVCGDGLTAIDICASDPPELMVLDMMLPGCSGFVVLERIRDMADPPVVFMVTGNEGRRHREYAEERGVAGYLNKPVSLDTLIHSACEALAKRERPRPG